LQNGVCRLSSLVLGVDGWMQENRSHAVLSLTRYQCSIHCESSHMVHGASKQKWAPQTTRDAPKGVQKPSMS